MAMLAEFDQNATIDVRVEGQPDGDWRVIGASPLIIRHLPNRGSWVTLTLENER